MSWVDTTEYNPNDICPICYETYGTTEAIYKTECNHFFHNDCLADYCEIHRGQIFECPVCRSDIDFCMIVTAFKDHSIGDPDGMPLFNGNQHILDIYNRGQIENHGGYKHKKTNKSNKSKRNNNKFRKTKKNKKTKKCKKTSK